MGLDVAVNERKPLTLITGATGAIGPAVLEAFRSSGFSIRTLSIDPPKSGFLPEGVEARIGDVTDPAAVSSAMQDADAVIHMAALLHIANPPSSMRERYVRINVQGTSTVAEAAVQAGVRRVVLFSTIAVYGPSRGQVLTEDTPPCPDTDYAQTKLAAEKIVLDAKGEDGSRIGAALRLGAVYGPVIKGNYERLLRSLAAGRFIPVGDGSNRRSLIYDKDVGRAAVLAATHSNAAGRVFNVTDGRFHSMKTIIATLCDALERPPPGYSLPLAPALRAASMLEKILRRTRLPLPQTVAALSKYAEDMAVDGSRIQQELGFLPGYDLTAGWRETVREMRRAGAL